MNNKIENIKTEVPTGLKLNDKDYLNCLLSCLKEMVKNYSTVLTEASNEKLYNSYKNMFLKYIELQREVFELAFRFGWYSLEVSDSTKVSEKYLTLNKEYIDLNING